MWSNPSVTGIDGAGIRINTGDIVRIGATLNLPSHNSGWGAFDDVHFHAVSLDPAAPPKISTTSLPSGNVGSPYRAVLKTQQSGTHKAINWGVAGSLPTGLMLNPVSGVISGIPESTGTTNFTVTAANVEGGVDSQSLSITIEDALGPAVSEIHTLKIDNLHPDFARGADISSFLALYEAGVRFYGFDGTEQSMFQTLADAGFNYVRIRVWVDPYVDVYVNGPGSATEKRPFGGGTVDVDAAIEMGTLAAQAGLYTKIAFHYSDMWADPGKQFVPRAWAGTTNAQRHQMLYDYTYDAVLRMLESGVMLGTVSIGNETNGSMAGMSGWGVNSAAMGAFHYGARAVRNAERTFRGYDLLPAVYDGANPRASYADDGFEHNILVAFHHGSPDGGNAANLINANSDFDVYGISAYPQWGHASGTALTNTMNTTHNIINPTSGDAARDRMRYVQIFETSHPTTPISGNMHEVIAPRSGQQNLGSPSTVQGSANAIREAVFRMHSTDSNAAVTARGGNIGGVFLWEPAWLPEAPGVSNDAGNWSYNFQRWEEDGTGWASSYALVHNAGDEGVMYGGGGAF